MNIFSATIMLILIMNPLGNIPVFLSALRSVDPKRHTFIIIRESIIAFMILMAFMFFGQYYLQGAQISEQALGVSGGIILFLISVRMIFPEEKHSNERQLKSEPFIVPLAIPLTAGPGALTTVMLFASQHPEKRILWLFAIFIASFIACMVILGARLLSNFFSERGLIALERLSGMMLTAMAVQMLLSGLDAYFRLH
ncbi:MAG: NAAT family transporter [Gammaproteobacteria bacterium]|nr:NAAT family transporter [Gammaproteobacteria bacterium]